MVRPRLIKQAPRLWVLWAASRPSQLALISLLYVLGVGMTAVGSPFVVDTEAVHRIDDTLVGNLNPLVTGAIALLLVAATVHYANEYADADTDALTDRTPFSGGSGALVETDLQRSFLRAALIASCIIATGTALLGIASGLLSTLAAGLLFACLIAGIAYSLPPIALIRRGIGEPVNMALGGLLVPLYGVAVVATPTVFTVLVLVPFTLVVGCNLLAVHWPDRRADAAVGKRTLAVRWSSRRIRRAFAVLALSAASITVALWWIDILPDAVALAHLTPVPFLVWGWRTLARQRSPLPAVAAMVVLAISSTISWWWVGLA